MITVIQLFAMGTEDLCRWLRQEGACSGVRSFVQRGHYTAWEVMALPHESGLMLSALEFLFMPHVLNINPEIQRGFYKALDLLNGAEELYASLPVGLQGTTCYALKEFLFRKIQYDQFSTAYFYLARLLNCIDSYELYYALHRVLNDAREIALFEARTALDGARRKLWKLSCYEPTETELADLY